MYRAATEEQVIDLVDSDDEKIHKLGDPIRFVQKNKNYMCCVHCDNIICEQSPHFQVTRNTFTPSLWMGPINRVHRYIGRQAEFLPGISIWRYKNCLGVLSRPYDAEYRVRMHGLNRYAFFGPFIKHVQRSDMDLYCSER